MLDSSHDRFEELLGLIMTTVRRDVMRSTEPLPPAAPASAPHITPNLPRHLTPNVPRA